MWVEAKLKLVKFSKISRADSVKLPSTLLNY